MRDLDRDIIENFDKADRAHLTKNLVERLRLGRNVKAPVEGAGEDYGNYQKFESNKNQVKEVNDPGFNDSGRDTFLSNLKKMYETMQQPDQAEAGKARDVEIDNTIEKSIKSQENDISLADRFF